LASETRDERADEADDDAGDDDADDQDAAADDDGDGDDAADDDEDAAEAEEQTSQTPKPVTEAKGTSAKPKEADQAPSRSASRGGRRAPASPLRFAFYAVWLFAVPGALAIGSIKLLEPAPHEIDSVGWLRSFVGQQQVPATIMAFMLFAMFLWRVRHMLPLAVPLGIVGRPDLPASMRARFDHAAHLLGEARRILEVHKAELKTLKAAQKRELEEALDRLEDEMEDEQFDEDAFAKAHEEAHELVHKRLERWKKSELREYTESIGFAIAVALVLRFFVIEAFKIPTGSMIPTLMVGDHIFVAKYAYGPLLPRSDSRLYSRLPPERGDVMVFKFPEKKDQDFIKRTIALPGDRLEVVDGRPIINGMLLPHCYVGKLEVTLGARGHLYVEYYADKAYLTMFNEKLESASCNQDLECSDGKLCRGHVCGSIQGPYRIGPGEVWVMGDNRDNSHDSRAWRSGLGAGVPFDHIKGRAMFVWWSWDARGGLAWDRLAVNVMGSPKLPKGAELLEPALLACLKNRPPADKTTPPAP
jgi:signal peptidase I